jgi:hypothetical protein
MPRRGVDARQAGGDLGVGQAVQSGGVAAHFLVKVLQNKAAAGAQQLHH